MLKIPPGTTNSYSTGTLSLTFSIQYLNIDKLSSQNIQLSVQMWGYPEPINLQHNLSSNSYCVQFQTTTSLHRLTEYFNDMAVVILFVGDKRTAKKLGVSYLKIRKYIINSCISQVEEQQITITHYSNNISAASKQTIGAAIFNLTYDINQQIPQKMQANLSDSLKPANKLMNTSRMKCDSIIASQQENIRSRKILVEPHILDPLENQHKFYQYQLNQRTHQRPKHNKKETNNNINKNTAQQHKYSLQEQRGFKSLAELQQKYGRNNPYLEKMKLKLDEITILDSHQFLSNPKNSQHQEGMQYVLFINTIKAVPPSTMSTISSIHDFEIVNLIEHMGGQESVVLKIGIKSLNEIERSPIFLGKIQLHSILEFETKLFKGRYQVRESMLTGEPKTIYLKKKENNKKCIQLEISLKRVDSSQSQEPLSKLQNKQPQTQTQTQTQIKSQKYNYYMSLQNLSKQPSKNTVSICVPSQQPFFGKKLMFTSIQDCLKVILKNQGGECSVEVRADILMKEEIVSLGRDRFCVKIGASEDMKLLMELMNRNQAEQKRQQLRNQRPFKHQNIDTQLIEDNRQVNTQNRRTKLKYLMKCLQCLNQSANSECHIIINKLLEYCERINQDLAQQSILTLFQELCRHANVPQPQKTTKLCFQQLLHSQFSMFWQCFQHYHQWNNKYHKSLIKINRDMREIIKSGDLQKDNNSMREYRSSLQIQKIMRKLITKLTNKSEVIFGLINKQSVQDTIYKFIIQNVLQGAQPENTHTIKNIIHELTQLLINRYSQSKIKIQQLQNLLTNPRNHGIMLNQQQLSVIYREHDHKELLEEVLISCGIYIEKVSNNNDGGLLEESNVGDIKGKTLYRILKESEEVDSSMLGTEEQENQEEDVVLTEYKKYLTEGNDEDWQQSNMGLRRKQAIDRSRKNYRNLTKKTKTEIQNISNLQIAKNINDSLNIKQQTDNEHGDLPKMTLIIKQLCLIRQPSSDIKLVIRSSQKQRQSEKIEIMKRDLPSAVTLVADSEYMVEILQQNGQMYCYGIFISSCSLKTIILYPNNQQNISIGHIQVGTPQQNKLQQAQDQIIIKLQNTTEYKDPYNPHLQTILANQQQLQNNIIIEQQQSRNLAQIANIRYQIISVIPQPKIGQTYQLVIEGVRNLIEYPYNKNIGVIQNQERGREYLWVDVLGKGREKLYKNEGVQQICILAPDHTLSEYIDSSIPGLNQQKQNIFTRVLLLNIYHLQSIQLLTTHKSQLQPSTQAQLGQKQPSTDLQLVITPKSNSQPISIKTLKMCLPQNIHNFTQNNPKKQISSLIGDSQLLRTMQLNQSIRLPASENQYVILIYVKNRNKSKNGRQLLANFQFSWRKCGRGLGVFENRGYLIDEGGYRLSVNLLQINYNDIFSKDQIGQQKFESLLKILQAQNLKKINYQLLQLQRDNYEISLKKIIRNYFGFSQSEIYILFELQQHPKSSNFVDLFVKWDIDHQLDHTEINLNNYSLKDMFEEFRLFDFKGDGLIPVSKLDIINKIVLKETPIQSSRFQFRENSNWMIDYHSKESSDFIDYMLILWNLRKFAKFDNFFATQINVIKGFGHENNQTIINALNCEQYRPFPKHKKCVVRLLQYKNLKVDGKAATLIFFINGIKLTEPKLRSYSHKYTDAPEIQTTFPLILQIRNKQYGYSSSLYEEEIVEKVQITGKNIRVLQGQILFEVDVGGSLKAPLKSKPINKVEVKEQVEAGKQTINKQRQISQKQKEKQKKAVQDSRRNSMSEFRKSRRQKWQNLQQSKRQTNKIRQLLAKTTQI